MYQTYIYPEDRINVKLIVVIFSSCYFPYINDIKAIYIYIYIYIIHTYIIYIYIHIYTYIHTNIYTVQDIALTM